MSSASSRATPSRTPPPLSAVAGLQTPRAAARPADEVVATHLDHGELELATAMLLPLLEAGSPMERQAAGLVRLLLARPSGARPGPVPAEQHLALAMRRMTDLLRQQERHGARLEAMLDGLV